MWPSTNPPAAASLSISLLTLVALLPMSVFAGDHFILTRLSSLAFARIDPIVNPGGVAAHVHNIMGASCIGDTPNSPEEQQACDCSSVIVGDDRSNYWAPALYYQDTNGTFSPILNGNRIYYFTKGPDIKPFPPGLRMITGMSKSRNATDTRSFGLRISCNHAGKEGAEGQFLPNGTSHPEGCSSVSMAIFFPSCGLADGSLDSEDHFSHMAWPINQLGGGGLPFDDVNAYRCPDSHPIKYPTIFMHASYYLSPEQPWHSGNPVILSNGDQTGLAYHADFFDGWNQQTLKDTLDQCGFENGPGDDLKACAPLAKSVNEEKTWWCRYQNKIPNEDVGFYRPLKSLPGCNPVWPADGPDTKPECVEENPPAMVYPNAQFENLSYRVRVPMLFTLADNTSDVEEMQQFIPGLGVKGASRVKTWGCDASNKDSLTISTVAQIEAAAGEPLEGVVTGGDKAPVESSAAASAAVSPSATVSAIAGANVHLAAPEAETKTADAASAAVSTPAAASSAVAVPSADASTTSTAATSSAAAEPAASDDAESTSPAAGKPKVCKRKKRGLVAKSDNVSHEIREHLQRRSRRALLGH